jgi:xanthine dehydrogenase YagR molybdenum-binding subunit
MATWPKQRRLLGTKIQRLDGPDKATGMAKYSYDINRPEMLHAKILRCPYAHARLKSLDTSGAEKAPGFRALQVIAKPGQEFSYAGDEILGVAADTEEHALDALRAVKVEYEVLDHLVKEEDALKATKGTVGKGSNVIKAGQDTKGDVDLAFKEAAAVVEGEYGIAVIAHQCLESHGLVAEWGPEDTKETLTVWASTQATTGVAGALAGTFKVAATQVKCITHYMGGGFGSKFGPGVEGATAAQLARKANKAVKLMLDREEEVTTAGTRPGAFGRVKIAGTKDGKITAFQATAYGSPGTANAGGVNFQALPYIYLPGIPNVKKEHSVIRLNAAPQRAWRAPGHPQSCVLTEWAVDDLAAKLNLDPMQVRLKNLPPNSGAGGTSLQAIWHTLWTDEIQIAAKLSDWPAKWHPPGKGPGRGPIKHGIGMALHTWGGGGRGPNDVTITISSDGSVLLTCSTQDLGTGERTVLATVAAEILGLEPKDITVRIGESPFGRSTGSGGSTTTPGTAPAALNAVTAARDELFKAIAQRLGVEPGDLSTEPGKLVAKNGKSWAWKEACAKLGMNQVVAKGDWSQGLSNQGVGGVQIAEVAVDTETGVVRCTKVVAVQDCGLVVNKQGCESQVAGGVIMGLNPALFEERIMDRVTGRQCNPDMEFYKLGGIEDMPQIVVHMMDMPERGVIGIGEPPTISTTAAIGNAVFNAIGVRVPHAPFTPDRVLEALAKA